MENFFKVIHWNFIEKNLDQDFSIERQRQSYSKEELRPLTL
jgi:hypothetical protein